MAMLISLSALVGIFPQTANAADALPVPYLSPAVISAATINTERNSLALCAAIGGSGSTISPADISDGKWFKNKEVRQWFDNTDGGSGGGVGCDSLDVNKYITDLGWAGNKIVAACAIGYMRSAANERNNCVAGNSDFVWGNVNKQDVLARIDKVYKGTPFGNNYNGPQRYIMAMSLLLGSQACNASATYLVSGATPDIKAKMSAPGSAAITVVDAQGSTIPTYFTFGGDQDASWGINNAPGNDTSYVSKNCKDLVPFANENAASYATWVQQNLPGSTNNPGTCEQYAVYTVGGPAKASSGANKALADSYSAACNDGLQNKADANYCTTKYPSSKSAALHNACLYGAKTVPVSSGSTDNPTAGGSKPTCGIDGIGWLVCPAMSFMATINDAAYGFLASYFLSIDTGLVSGSKDAWSKFRDIANVAFVIAILFIVYSQITSVGLNNYGVKRMLPRLVVAALLVNLSFYICAVAVDLSNVLGYAVPAFFNNIIPLGGPVGSGGGVAGSAVAVVGWTAAIAGVLAGAVGIALAISVPVLLAALLAIGLVVLMLIGRQAFIVLLIVISPLAFVAYLLPNTEQWFKKWYKAFSTLLMLFPIIGAVFGASRMAANIIKNAGAAAGDPVVMGVVALGVSSVPFFVVPSLLKGSLAAAGTIGSKLSGMTGNAGKKVGARVKDSSKLGTGLADMKKNKDQQRAIGFAKSRGKGLTGIVGRVKGGKGYNTKARLRSETLENQEYEEDVKAAMERQAIHSTFDEKMDIANGTTKKGISVTDRDAAIRFMTQNGNADQRREVLYSMDTMTQGQRRSAVGAARSKGDGSVYGNATLGELEDMKDEDIKTKDVKAMIDEGTVRRINSKEISPETFTRDTYTSSYIAEQAEKATTEGKNTLAQSLSDYAATDQGKKATGATQVDVSRVIANAPTPPTSQAAANPQTQAPTQLNIAHGNSPATQPPANTPANSPPPAQTPPPAYQYPPTNPPGTPPTTP